VVLVLLLALATILRLKFEVNELERTPPAKRLSRFSAATTSRVPNFRNFVS
jgi:hypothetical protein